ncbi:MAG: ABC transporter permease [Peptostreptococcaceae bacterium]
MLGKLLKYEFKATARIFLPLYITLLVVALINGFFINSEMFQIQGLLMMVFGALLIALFVITVIVLVQRFSKNLLGDEGYLMFTLPVKSTSILFSKYLIALLWTVLSVMVSIIAFFLITLVPIWSELGTEISYIFQSISEFFSIMVNEGYLPFAINIALLMFISYSVFIFTVYLALAMGQLPIFNKHRNLASFISFIAINVVFSFIQNLFALFYFNGKGEQIMMSIETDPISGVTSLVQTGFLTTTIFNFVLLIVLFFGTKIILDKKLNLE